MDRLCWQCGTTLAPPKRSTGRQAHFCSARCRQAAARDRRRAESAAPPIPPDEEIEKLIEAMFVSGEDPIDSAIEVTLALRSIAGRTRRLSMTGPPQLRWRHSETTAVLDDLLARLWPAP